ncbi:hypothetical protein [Agathobaculum sp. Marseille-P7918]|uniref:hypothetical protein n=1 Tax=Agathobaculum sp. Marseille-P7918 TaxID=2479843 RepID=UPI001FAAE464|nr:hypothetical protein [Agathobaculum sp. Marseille-P7918]
MKTRESTCVDGRKQELCVFGARQLKKRHKVKIKEHILRLELRLSRKRICKLCHDAAWNKHLLELYEKQDDKLDKFLHRLYLPEKTRGCLTSAGAGNHQSFTFSGKGQEKAAPDREKGERLRITRSRPAGNQNQKIRVYQDVGRIRRIGYLPDCCDIIPAHAGLIILSPQQDHTHAICLAGADSPGYRLTKQLLPLNLQNTVLPIAIPIHASTLFGSMRAHQVNTLFFFCP